MTIKEDINLQIIKNIISEYFDNMDITDIELYEIIEKYSIVDLSDLDLLQYEENKDELINSIEEHLSLKQSIQKLETLFLYIKNKDYDLDTLLDTVNYNEDNFDISTLTENDLDYITNEIEYYVSELDYTTEKNKISKKLEIIENSAETKQLLKEKNQLLKQIEQLKKENVENKLKHSLEQLKIVQAKEFLSTSELAILFPHMSVERQKTYRGRLHDPLPYEQLNRNCKIVYDRKKVDIWKINNNK